MLIVLTFKLRRKKMNKIMHSPLVIACLILSSPVYANSTTRTAMTCSYQDVSAAVQSSQIGDTVQIPAGICEWSTSSPLVVRAGIRIKGAGKNYTTIKKSMENNSSLIQYDCTNGNSVIFSDMTLVGFVSATTTQVLDSGLELAFGCSNFQVYRISFRNFGSAGISISDFNNNNSTSMKGVIYRNEFISNFKGNTQAGYGVVVYDDGISSQSLQLGSDNAVFVEDNIFVANKHAIASNFGSNYVLRNNTLIDNKSNFSAVDAHGKSNPNLNGSFSWEIYKNEIYQTTANTFGSNPNNTGYAGIGIRGGTGVIFKNNIINFNNPILLTVENSSACGGMSYPVEGQPGTPTKIYIWDNSPNQVKVSTGCEHLIQVGRDYAIEKPIEYAEYIYPHPLRLD
jgi:hypothetical protein